jgi:hypothetical protein
MYTQFLQVEAEWASSGATEAPTVVALNGRRLLEEEDPDAGRISVARKQLKKATMKRNLNMLYYLWKKDAYKMMKHKYNELLKTVPFTMRALLPLLCRRAVAGQRDEGAVGGSVGNQHGVRGLPLAAQTRTSASASAP